MRGAAIRTYVGVSCFVLAVSVTSSASGQEETPPGPAAETPADAATLEAVAGQFVEGLQRWRRGEPPLHVIDRVRGY